MAQAVLRSMDENDELLRMSIADESGRSLGMFKELFRNDFIVSSLDMACLDTTSCEDMLAPHILLYVSHGKGGRAAKYVEQVRSVWPRTIVVLLLPVQQDEEWTRKSLHIPAHKVLFKPYSKKMISQIVSNYRTLLISYDNSDQTDILLSCFMEFVGGNQPELYVAFNRLTPLVFSLCQGLGYDWKPVQRVLSMYLLLLSSMDEKYVNALMRGEGRKARVITEAYEQISKMVDLLSMNPSTLGVGQGLKYVLKRFDGEGVPDDSVSGLEIPVASRIIRLLFDYNYLLQTGKNMWQVLFILNKRTSWYDSVMVHQLVDILGEEGKHYTREVYPLGLMPGMVVAQDVFGVIDGKRTKVIGRNEILTEDAVDYLQRHCDDILDITEPIMIVEDIMAELGREDA